MNLKYLGNTDVSGKRVLLRADLDVDLDSESELLRLKVLKDTILYLINNKANIVIIGHKGRPNGKKDPALSLVPVCKKLSEIIEKEIVFVDEVTPNGVDGEIVMLENLRFDPGEEKNDPEFARKLASLADIYVNDAFASSHRPHASIVGILLYTEGVLGLRFEKEIENLSKVLDNPQRPVVVIISGVKEDKIEYAKSLSEKVDKVLIGGRLPEMMGVDKSIREYKEDEKTIIANLVYDKEDITVHSIERFKEEIKAAKTIILAGVLGKYEDEGHRQGTKEIFTEVSNSSAFKIVGGGDSLMAIEMFNLSQKFDWISVGGGAMLEYLAKGTLMGLEALK